MGNQVFQYSSLAGHPFCIGGGFFAAITVLDTQELVKYWTNFQNRSALKENLKQNGYYCQQYLDSLLLGHLDWTYNYLLDFAQIFSLGIFLYWLVLKGFVFIWHDIHMYFYIIFTGNIVYIVVLGILVLHVYLITGIA